MTDDARPLEPETIAARTQRQFVNAAARYRPRTPADATDPAVPVAATVVLVRDGADGPEVLLLERPDRGSFAGAWVFPGGKLEASDGAGLGADATEEDRARYAAVRETSEETGLELTVAGLQSLSRWDPPPGIALRIRTWFFLASAPAGALALQPDEAVDAMWTRPADALSRHGDGALALYPPTWVTLAELAGYRDVESLLAAVRLRGTQSFESVLRTGPNGPVFLWEGDAEWAEGADGEASARHRLEIGALPWIYIRSG